MRNLIDIVDRPSEITLWHGGRGLEFNYRDIIAHRTGRWEHGPGLYLTTHYETAAKYAKGGGKTYLVTVRQGTDIDSCTVPLEDAVEFVNRYVVGRMKKPVIADLQDNLNRVGHLNADVIVNLCLNRSALSPASTEYLRKFLIDHGVDYISVNRFGGRDEKLLVVVNPAVVIRVDIVPAKAVTENERILPFTFS